MAQEKINALDVFDWDYLCKIGVNHSRHEIRTLQHAVEVFAYQLTSMQDQEQQNRLLSCWIQNATFLQSTTTAEEVLSALARYTRANLEVLRRFAKQNGVRLKRG